MDQEFLRKLTDIMGEGNVLPDELMSGHITFRVGGKASYFVEISDGKQLKPLIGLLKNEQMPYYIIGNGSNLLVKDEGYKGVIVKIGGKYSDIKIVGEKIYVNAGAMLSKTAKLACEAGLLGMEHLSGIPGTIGGAVAMNAGAYGSEIKDVIVSATVFDRETEEIVKLGRDELELGYRHSIIMEKEYIVLEAEFKLSFGNKEEIKAEMDRCTALRKEKQPLEYPSAGSTFKRPKGYFAGKLIEDAGLRGYASGDACVSEKHCGFVVNKGNATATDILNVIDHVHRTVKEKFGVELEPEVRIL